MLVGPDSPQQIQLGAQNIESSSTQSMGACSSTPTVVTTVEESVGPDSPLRIQLGAQNVEVMEASPTRADAVEIEVMARPVMELANDKPTERQAKSPAAPVPVVEAKPAEVVPPSPTIEGGPVTPPAVAIVAVDRAVAPPAPAPAKAQAPATVQEAAAASTVPVVPVPPAAPPPVPAPVELASEATPRELASDLLLISRPVLADLLTEKEVKQEGGPLGGVPQEWDAFNSEELKVLRQVKSWMSDTPGLFDRANADALVCYLRGYAPLVNWADHVYARMHAMLKWRMEERIDTVRSSCRSRRFCAWHRCCARGPCTARALLLTNARLLARARVCITLQVLTDDAWVSPDLMAIFDEALPCGPIGYDEHGHAVCLETPGASSTLLNKLFQAMDADTFVRATARPCACCRREAATRQIARAPCPIRSSARYTTRRCCGTTSRRCLCASRSASTRSSTSSI